MADTAITSTYQALNAPAYGAAANMLSTARTTPPGTLPGYAPPPTVAQPLESAPVQADPLEAQPVPTDQVRPQPALTSQGFNLPEDAGLNVDTDMGARYANALAGYRTYSAAFEALQEATGLTRSLFDELT